MQVSILSTKWYVDFNCDLYKVEDVFNLDRSYTCNMDPSQIVVYKKTYIHIFIVLQSSVHSFIPTYLLNSYFKGFSMSDIIFWIKNLQQ